MEEKIEQRLVKGGVEETRHKRAAQLKTLANDPKPKKLKYFSQTIKVSIYISYTFLIKEFATTTVYFIGVVF